MPGFDQTAVEAEHVGFLSVIELPFRVRLGRYFRKAVSPDCSLEIACWNRIRIPRFGNPRKPVNAEQLPRVADRHLLNTPLAVIENKAKQTEDDLAKIRSANPFSLTTDATQLLRGRPGVQLICVPDMSTHLAAIRRFVELYFRYCPPEYRQELVRPLWLHDYMSQLVVCGVCLHHPAARLPDGFVKALLQSGRSDLAERDLDALFRADAAVLQRRRFAQALRGGEQPAFADQLSLLTHFFLEQFNYEMAVLTSVAALEAAVFAFARARLGSSLQDDPGLLGQFLRDEGASSLVQVLPRLFFSPVNLPSTEDFMNVKRAISARNRIMHGKVDGSGKPEHENMGHLGSAVCACLRLAEAFQRETALKVKGHGA